MLPSSSYSLQPTAYSLKSRASKPRMPPHKSEPVRCTWPLKGNALYLAYHDSEWGVPAWDDQTQFEFLILEGAQAGLSWSTILNKREGYRAAFAGFNPERIARFGKREIARLMNDAGIVRNRLKIESAVINARAFLEFKESHGSLAGHLWSFVGGKPIQNRFRETKEVPATSPESDAISKDLKKRGFKFVGSTIIYAHMQATGMVNDHLVRCFRYKECKALGKRE
jgi:DNA-3-methyladenine glycosylase I